MEKTILITGAAGYIGSLLVQQLLENKEVRIIGVDIQKGIEADGVQYIYHQGDIRTLSFENLLSQYTVDTVIHLATITRAPKDEAERSLFYEIEFTGTKRLLEACVATQVQRFIFTSSGAAYGYHPDLPEWISEDTPLRGNQTFTYSWHKRLIEEMLVEYRQQYPQLEQCIFRVGTILGKTVKNGITDFFDQQILMDLSDADSRFVFIWDQDVVRCLAEAIFSNETGIYNLAGDGALSLKEVAEIAGKRRIVLPANLFVRVLRTLNKFGFEKFNAEQIPFIRYRPVLDNQRIKSNFGFVPKKNSEEVFQYYWKNKLAKY